MKRVKGFGRDMILPAIIGGLVIGVTLFTVVSIVIVALINGLVLSILWGWFIAEYFGVFPLSVPVAIGIFLVWGLLGSRSDPSADKAFNVTIEKIRKGEEIEKEAPQGEEIEKEAPQWIIPVKLFLKPASFLFMGWIVHLFM